MKKTHKGDETPRWLYRLWDPSYQRWSREETDTGTGHLEAVEIAARHRVPIELYEGMATYAVAHTMTGKELVEGTTCHSHALPWVNQMLAAGVDPSTVRRIVLESINPPDGQFKFVVTPCQRRAALADRSVWWLFSSKNAFVELMVTLASFLPNETLALRDELLAHLGGDEAGLAPIIEMAELAVAYFQL